MRAYKLLSVMTLAVALQAGITQARTLSSDDGPAETPPPGYSDRQYIDSRGCVYVRAGFGGQVQWIPRLSRDRKVLCGFKPTFAAAPTPPPAPSPVAVAKPAPPADPTAAPSPVAERKPAAQPVTGMAQPRARATPRQRTAIAEARAQDACGAAEIRSARYVRDGAAVAVRCGEIPPPETASAPAPARRPAEPRQSDPWYTAAAENLCGGGAILSARHMDIGKAIEVSCGPKPEPADAEPSPRPLSLTVNRPAPPAPVKVAIPHGYEPAWKDGRLNPRRAQGTPDGEAAMRRIWTDTVPRRLVAAYVKRQPRPAPSVRPDQVMSTKAMPVESRVASGRFIQVGVFGEAANTRRALARLRDAGLPVDVTPVVSGGRSLQRVQVGPLGSGEEIQAALAAARVAGYRDAFLRR